MPELTEHERETVKEEIISILNKYSTGYLGGFRAIAPEHFEAIAEEITAIKEKN